MPVGNPFLFYNQLGNVVQEGYDSADQADWMRDSNGNIVNNVLPEVTASAPASDVKYAGTTIPKEVVRQGSDITNDTKRSLDYQRAAANESAKSILPWIGVAAAPVMGSILASGAPVIKEGISSLSAAAKAAVTDTAMKTYGVVNPATTMKSAALLGLSDVVAPELSGRAWNNVSKKFIDGGIDNTLGGYGSLLNPGYYTSATGGSVIGAIGKGMKALNKEVAKGNITGAAKNAADFATYPYRVARNISDPRHSVWDGLLPYGYDLNGKVAPVLKNIFTGKNIDPRQMSSWRRKSKGMFHDYDYSKIADGVREDAMSIRFGFPTKGYLEKVEPNTYTSKIGIKNAENSFIRVPVDSDFPEDYKWPYVDFITNAGGHTDKYIKEPIKGTNLTRYIINDTWDIHPFKRYANTNVADYIVGKAKEKWNNLADRTQMMLLGIKPTSSLEEYRRWHSFKKQDGNNNAFYNWYNVPRFLTHFDNVVPRFDTNKTVKRVKFLDNLWNELANKDVLEMIGGEKPFKLQYDIMTRPRWNERLDKYTDTVVGEYDPDAVRNYSKYRYWR